MEACLDDPVSAISELQDEQRRIADELEQTFLTYDGKLQAAAKRIASLGPESVTPEEREHLRAEQLELWRLVRRAQAAARSTRDLAREVREWQEHGPTHAPEGHPDHPNTRVEIAESELRVRGVISSSRSSSHTPDPLEKSMRDAAGIHALHAPGFLAEDAEEAAARAIAQALAEEEEAASYKNPPSTWEHDGDEALLREIHHHERELARSLAAPHEEPQDIAALVKGLRSLHAHLRVHDRRTNHSRVRYTLGFRHGIS
ncbi:MAG: hypothetical protein RL141_364 [Candidatus Parcubacteria bacterium]